VDGRPRSIEIIVLKLKLVINSVSVWGHPNIRTWEPDDPKTIAEIVTLDIGPKSKKWSNSFSLRGDIVKSCVRQHDQAAMS
jgi:hypothetical protein